MSILFFLSFKLVLDLVFQQSDSDFFYAISAVVILFGNAILLFRNDIHIKELPLGRLMLILITFNILSAIWGIVNSYFLIFEIPHSPIRFGQVVTWTGKMLGIFIPLLSGLAAKKSDLSLKQILLAFVLGTIPVCIVGLFDIGYQFFKLNEESSLKYHTTWRISGGLSGPGTLAITMLLGSSFALYLLFFNQFNKRVYNHLMIVYLAIAYIVLTFTMSRGAWISLIFFCFILLLHLPTIKSKLIAAMALLLLFINPIIWERFNKETKYLANKFITDKTTIDVTKLGSGRIWLWNDAIQHYTKLDPVSQLIGSGGYYGSHNQYIAWLLRNGILGLFMWLLFLYLMYRKILTMNKPSRSLATALFLCICCVANMFSQPWDNFNISFIFWFLIGFNIIVSTDKVKNRENCR
ncbi:hypothetical protein L6Q79_08375 [bacterium]|nr:hypothetical protein [bacterium]NUN46806.1 hypothetical protein [bacterium]